MSDLIDIIPKLAESKLNFSSVVVIRRDWVVKDNYAYLEVIQDNQFKFHIMCEPNNDSLTKNEEDLSLILTDLGYKVKVHFSH